MWKTHSITTPALKLNPSLNACLELIFVVWGDFILDFLSKHRLYQGKETFEDNSWQRQ
ncbi:hypothetical protein [cyanobacterium endosymbiont of Rhopalodia gibberula]|uniref:hypothetical protein n=1 Tax=cyanobacterium endosymbiont of Rhopalodia gibberula TaxID=1763363 RepID=UPI001558B569|nr:hypothetical protein [cyanobacterium endosymbiont of Rhopalodia gibberula]